MGQELSSNHRATALDLPGHTLSNKPLDITHANTLSASLYACAAAANPRNRATNATPTYTSNQRHRGGYQLGTNPG